MTTNSEEGETFGQYDIASIDRRIEWCSARVDSRGSAADEAAMAGALAVRSVAEALLAIADAIRGRK